MNNVNILKKYIKNIKNFSKDQKCICNTKNSIVKKNSKAQTVQICNNTVIKSSSNKSSSERIEKKNNSTIKIDNVTLNLLIQTIIKLYIENMNNPKLIEHYNTLCSNQGVLKLVSQKANYEQNGKYYPTLEDYILKSKDFSEDKIKFIIECLTKIFIILDKLYEDIQFHHCDPKCAQIFLFEEKNSNLPIVMLGDLDKVTFTININNKPYRIRLTKDKKKYTIRGIVLSAASKIKYLNKITDMRFQNKAINSNLLEKISFISSACILLNNYSDAIKLRDIMLSEVFKKYNYNKNINFNEIIKLEDYYSKKYNEKRAKSFSYAINIVNYNYLFKKFKRYLVPTEKLYSIICLDKIKDENKYYIHKC